MKARIALEAIKGQTQRNGLFVILMLSVPDPAVG